MNIKYISITLLAIFLSFGSWQGHSWAAAVNIGVADTLRWADLIQAKTFRAFEAFIVAAAVYYVLVMALNFLGGLLEKKVRVSD